MEKEINKLKENLIENYSPKAIGIFGSGAKKIRNGRDVDMYVLSDNFYRDVFLGKDNVYEIYFGESSVIGKAIEMENIEIIDRFRNSKIIYDPHKIYNDLIIKAKNQKIIKEEWREKTIIGGKYDLVERTREYIDRNVKDGNLESAVSSLQSLMNRVLDIGFRRVNETGYANPKNIPELVLKHFPDEMNDLYRKIIFSDIRDENKIKEIIQYFEKNKHNILPPR